MNIDAVALHLLETPLETPYVSSLGTTSSIRSVLARVRTADGVEVSSEVTPIRGYNEESADEIWEFCTEMAASLPGLAIEDAHTRLSTQASSRPYCCSPLLAALEQVLPASPAGAPRAARVELMAPVMNHDPARIEKEVEGLLGTGYRVLKMKAGMRYDEDLSRIQRVRRILHGRATVRIDFNGAYDAPTALRFLGSLGPEGIALAEQPCAAGDWEGNATVARGCDIPVMLDESICSADDVLRAGRSGCFRFFKLKLGKLPSVAALDAAFAAGRDTGLTGVIGNGAATDVACRLEALVAARHPAIAGEMNGFLKNRVQYLKPPLRCEQGAILLDEALSSGLNEHAVARQSAEMVDFPSGAFLARYSAWRMFVSLS